MRAIPRVFLKVRLDTTKGRADPLAQRRSNFHRRNCQRLLPVPLDSPNRKRSTTIVSNSVVPLLPVPPNPANPEVSAAASTGHSHLALHHRRTTRALKAELSFDRSFWRHASSSNPGRVQKLTANY